MTNGGLIPGELSKHPVLMQRGSRGVLAVLSLPRILWEHRELVKAMARRSLKARFRGSVLGLLWPLIHPFCLFWVYLFLFAKILAASKGIDLSVHGLQGVDQQRAEDYYFAVYLFSGILAWTAFAEAVQRNAQCVTGSGNLIKKMAFPSEIIPLAECLATSAIQIFGTTVFLGFMFVGGLWPSPSISQLAVFPILLVLQLVFTYGLGLIVGTLQVFLRDTDHILTVFLTFWMFLTPIFWSVHLPQVEPYRDAIQWNPMYHLMEAYRNVLVHPGHDWFIWESWRPVAIFALVSVITLWLGVWFFESKRNRFADEI
jgi:ABC-type polysaccharide/polyol phosphate export permease